MRRSRINVLHIIKSLGRGGAEMLLPETLKLHDRQQFDFHYVYFLPWKNQMVKSIEDHGGRVTCFSARNNIQLFFKIRKVASFVRAHQIQLIHAHLPWAGILARVVGKLTGVPVIYTEHNKQERYHVATRAMNLLSMNLLDAVVAVSSDVAESIYRHKPRLRPVVHKILNGVNTVHFNRQTPRSEEVRIRLMIPREAPIIGTIAVFRFQKRLDLWMELAAKILEHNKDVHFVLVGDGPLKNDLLAKRDLLGLRDRVHLPGLETEVRPYLEAFDLYMMCSVFEGLPVAMLEAMAMACPVIATDAGGTREVIRHEQDGLLCPVEKPEQLVGYAASLLSDRSLRTRYGLQGRKRVVESFSMEKMVGELETLYQAVLYDRERNPANTVSG